MVSVLVIDVGTSSVRVAVFDEDANPAYELQEELLPYSPADGLVEFDAGEMAGTCLRLARAAIDHAGSVDAVGVSNQRGSTILWDRATGEPLGPGLGWQDLRTVGQCLALKADDLRVGPNESATKLQWLLQQLPGNGRGRALCFGTVDSWIAWTLSGGALHVTDATNAAITGMQVMSSPSTWNGRTLEILGVDPAMLPTIVDTAGVVGEASALPGAPPIAALVGDQQASLVGQGCVRRGDAKITFGTGGMLDLVLGPGAAPFGERDDSAATVSTVRPRRALEGGGRGRGAGSVESTRKTRGKAGTFPIVAWRRDGRITWGIEAIMLAAGTNVQWLRDDLGIIRTAAESDTIASKCDDTGGVVYVPAPLGLGTPMWDYGARGALFGLTRGTGPAEIVRAVLEGVAQRGADLVEAAEADSGITIPALRVDGGMTDNATFVHALADAAQKPVEISPMREATARGAALLALLAIGRHGSVDDLASSWSPRTRIEPERVLDRARWQDAVQRARNWIPDLSGIDF